MSEKDKPLPSLSELREEIDKMSKPEGKSDEKSTSSSDMHLVMRVAVDLVAGVAVGSIAGFLLDRWLGTLPLFFILFFFLGFAGGFRNMLRSVTQNDKKDA